MSLRQAIERLEIEAIALELDELLFIEEWLERHRRKHHHHHLRLAITVSVPTLSVKGIHMAASINTAQKISLTAGYVDASGGTTNVTPPPSDVFTWAIDASGAATLDSTTGPTVNLVGATPGTGTVTLTDSAGLPAATLAYTVVADAATGLTITVGVPVAR